jgi:hypothetical protein
VPFHLANFQCASFAINTIKDPAEVGNVSDSDLYIDSPVGISFVMFVIDIIEQNKVLSCAHDTTKFA